MRDYNETTFEDLPEDIIESIGDYIDHTESS